MRTVWIECECVWWAAWKRNETESKLIISNGEISKESASPDLLIGPHNKCDHIHIHMAFYSPMLMCAPQARWKGGEI